jgi:Flp pilus assembly protein TadB
MIRIAYSSGSSSLRGPKAVLAVLAAVAGLLLAAVAALFAAATVVVAAVIGTTLLGLAAVTGRLRRQPVRAASGPRADDGVIEARRVGGHEWVAYGWNDRDGPER